MDNFSHSYGCLPAKKDLRDYRVCAAFTQQEFPKSFELENLPDVKCQGQVNSCCAHATSSILEYYDKKAHPLSTNFIYGIQKKLFNQTEMGMYLVDACKIVTQYGDMLLDDCQGNTEIPECYSVAEKAFADPDARNRAIYFKTLNYYLCKTDDDIKYALMNYGPVLGAIFWREAYSMDKSGVVYFDTRSTEGGGHAVMIYGWDERGWKIQNSWGEDFANSGRFILPFSYGLEEARALVDFDNNTDQALFKPKRTWFLNILYKIGNFLLNLN